MSNGKLERLSPGIYRDASGRSVLQTSGQQASGLMGAPPKAKAKGKAKAATYAGLNKKQAAVINQTNTGDLALAKGANAQLPQVQENFQDPFDFEGLPQAPNGIDYSGVGKVPGTGDFQQYQQDAVGAMTGAFDNRFNKIFKQQDEDFEQTMANKGVPMGSAQYNDAYQQLKQSQADAQSQNLAQSYGMAGTQAGQLANVGFTGHALEMEDIGTKYNMGNQAYQDAYGRTLQQRYQPLNDYNALRAGMSSMPTQNLSYAQQRALAEQQAQIARSMPRGGGGGGGGEAWQQMGFSSPMEYMAWQQAQKRDQQQWEWENDPRYRDNSPSTGTQIAGGLGGIFGEALKGWGSSGFSKFW